jgi:hypothetical protein
MKQDYLNMSHRVQTTRKATSVHGITSAGSHRRYAQVILPFAGRSVQAISCYITGMICQASHDDAAFRCSCYLNPRQYFPNNSTQKTVLNKQIVLVSPVAHCTGARQQSR